MQRGRPRRPNRQPRRGNHAPNSGSATPPSAQHQTTRSYTPRSTATVPAYAALRAGTPVSIVLKVDQPTGRQVTGIVADVLTSGDHPRGVKVRLRDGRVGRVQGLVAEAEGERGEAEVGGAEAGLGRNGEEERGRGRGGRGARGAFRGVRDVRDDEYVWDESRERQLGEYFAGLDLEGTPREVGVRDGFKSELVTCPVCTVFEGDERAVAFHVEQHFQDG